VGGRPHAGHRRGAGPHLSSEVGDLERLERERARERRETEKEVMEAIGRLRFGFARKLVFRTVLRFAQTYLMFRENQRFYLDHMIYRWRKLFLEYGRRLTERGLLDDPMDVFFLSKEEVFDLCAKGGDLRAVIPTRREEFERFRDVLPPKFLRGNGSSTTPWSGERTRTGCPRAPPAQGLSPAASGWCRHRGPPHGHEGRDHGHVQTPTRDGRQCLQAWRG
jgi:pyruvate,water dikinase